MGGRSLGVREGCTGDGKRGRGAIENYCRKTHTFYIMNESANLY